MSCCEPKDNSKSIYRGDDTGAFGQTFLTIEALIPEEWEVTKAIWKAGEVVKVFPNPNFPLSLNLSHEESLKLQNINTCYLAVYDKDGLKQTCEGSLTFTTKAEVVEDVPSQV